MKVTPDPRVKLAKDYTLQISNAIPSDYGDYTCQVATLEPREITHHVEILSEKFFLFLFPFCFFHVYEGLGGVSDIYGVHKYQLFCSVSVDSINNVINQKAVEGN